MSALVELRGTPRQRGLGQATACPASIAPVRALVEQRLAAHHDRLAGTATRRLLDAQWDYAQAHAPRELQELVGVADGYAIPPRRLHDFLHLGMLAPSAADDGCSTLALANSADGPLLAKNRDFYGADLGLQRVFHHVDPDWKGRQVLAVGSLGAPGVYSSGINNDGLALVDTRVITRDQGPGWLRYFLMTDLLAHCASVDAALTRIRHCRHLGGGNMLLADASGAIAAVELGHRRVHIERSPNWTARTNHPLDHQLASADATPPHDPMRASSRARLATLENWARAAGATTRIDALQALQSRHTFGADEGLCRHGEDGDAVTLSAAVFACGSRTLYFCAGNPCAGTWARYSL